MIRFNHYNAKLITSTAGNWVFSGRRWLNPETAGDRAMVMARHLDLCAEFPAYAAACDPDHPLATLARFRASWAGRLESAAADGAQRDSETASANESADGSAGAWGSAAGSCGSGGGGFSPSTTPDPCGAAAGAAAAGQRPHQPRWPHSPFGAASAAWGADAMEGLEFNGQAAAAAAAPLTVPPPLLPPPALLPSLHAAFATAAAHANGLAVCRGVPNFSLAAAAGGGEGGGGGEGSYGLPAGPRRLNAGEAVDLSLQQGHGLGASAGELEAFGRSRSF